MRVAALFSGGKDSTFAIYKTKKEGHEIKCLITILPISDESHLLHFPDVSFTKLQARSMSLPQIFIKSEKIETEHEIEKLIEILKQAKDDFSIQGLVNGGITSEFQRKTFEKVCFALNLELLSPIWNTNPALYMKELLETGFHFILTSVTSEGLDDSWLGQEITKKRLEKLQNLSEKYNFNLNFEGGEAETFVVNCPLFSYPIKINNAKKTWDGYRGRFEIVEAELDYNA